MAAWRTGLRAGLLAMLLAPAALAQEAPAQPDATPPAQPPDAAPDAATPTDLVQMGTGSVNGVYFPVGVAICRLANQHRPETGVRCSARPTAGSLENIAGLRDGSLGFAIVQSDALAQAAAGSGPFASAGAFAELRTAMSLYPEALTLVVRADAGVARLEDLAGKRVAPGEQGSGTRALVDALSGALGWTDASFGETSDVGPERLAQALCDNQVDGFFYAVGHPARVIQEVTTSCDARLVPVTGAAVDALVKSEPWYVPATIPGGLYRGTSGPVATFGVSAVLATSAATPDATVQLVVKSAADQLDMLKGLDPALGDLTPGQMTAHGPAPLHPGAETVYREKGWLD